MAIGSVHKSSVNVSVAFDYDASIGRFINKNEEKKPELVLKFNLISDNAEGIKRELNAQANENKRLKNKAIRFSINFPDDDETPENLRLDFIKNVMEEMGIDENNHLATVFKHNDKHPHYHILAVRVGLNGKTLSDSHSKRRLELALDKWEKKMGLDNSLSTSRAFIYSEIAEKGYITQKRRVYSDERKQKIPKDEFIRQNIEEVLNKFKIETPEELQEILMNRGVNFYFSVNKNGLAGTSFEFKNKAVKGSKIGFKANTLKGIFLENKRQNELIKNYRGKFNQLNLDLFNLAVSEFKKNKREIEFENIMKSEIRKLIPKGDVWELIRILSGDDYWSNSFFNWFEEEKARIIAEEEAKQKQHVEKIKREVSADPEPEQKIIKQEQEPEPREPEPPRRRLRR